MLSTEFHVDIAVYATLEWQHCGLMTERTNTKDASETNMKIILYALFRHVRLTGQDIAWDKVEFIEFERRIQCRKMKDSFFL